MQHLGDRHPIVAHTVDLMGVALLRLGNAGADRVMCTVADSETRQVPPPAVRRTLPDRLGQTGVPPVRGRGRAACADDRGRPRAAGRWARAAVCPGRGDLCGWAAAELVLIGGCVGRRVSRAGAGGRAGPSARSAAGLDYGRRAVRSW